jgi:hypothetical protein
MWRSRFGAQPIHRGQPGDQKFPPHAGGIPKREQAPALQSSSTATKISIPNSPRHIIRNNREPAGRKVAQLPKKPPLVKMRHIGNFLLTGQHLLDSIHARYFYGSLVWGDLKDFGDGTPDIVLYVVRTLIAAT